jgi:Carboxypeptidase regulatory-like domain
MAMGSAQKDPCNKTLGRAVPRLALAARKLVWLSLSVLPCSIPALAQSQQPLPVQGAQSGVPDARVAAASADGQQADPQAQGTVAGTIVDPTGELVPEAHVKLTPADQSSSQEAVSDNNGQFYFLNVAPGNFQLTISANNFATQIVSGTVHSGEHYVAPQIVLAVAPEVTEVHVGLSQVEIAEEQIKVEETQRVLGFIPNFYVSYIADAAPLTSRQKFELAWRTTIDPVTFGLTAAAAGIEQASDQYSGFGQGAQGYGKRFGAAYADTVSGTFIGSAILPSLLKQDPRYFYKGTGTARSRILYAIANAVICRGDNKHWQPNYSNVVGSFAASGISNLYYPTSDRNGAELAFENGLIGIGETAAANIFQEFIVRKFTPSASKPNPSKP